MEKHNKTLRQIGRPALYLTFDRSRVFDEEGQTPLLSSLVNVVATLVYSSFLTVNVSDSDDQFRLSSQFSLGFKEGI